MEYSGRIRLTTIAAVVGLIVSIIAWIATNPLSPDSPLGMPGWPPAVGRQALMTLWCLVVFLPLMYLFYLMYVRHNEWLVPRGEIYDPQKTYRVWTTRRVVEAAVASGFYLAASMIKIPIFQELDLMYIAGMFTVIFWGAPVAFVMSIVGSILRCIAGGFPTYFDILTCALGDGVYWVGAAFLWRRFVEEAKGAKRLAGMVGIIAFIEAAFWVIWFVIVSSIAWSWDTFVPFVVGGTISYAPVILIGCIIGLIAAEAAIRASKR
ncbi:hypothetical protein [[Eubacterium] cellulosolvens]